MVRICNSILMCALLLPVYGVRAGTQDLVSPRVALTAASGATYYVDSQYGLDTNSGSPTHPWQTIRKAANTVVAGDTVVVLAGNYPERVYLQRSGAAGAPITFLGQGRVVTRGFTILADYVTILGFEITDTPDDWRDGWGIFVNGGNCLIAGNYVHYATRGGITLWVSAGAATYTHDCVVRNNRLNRNALVGIEVHGRNNRVVWNEVWGTIQYHPKGLKPPSWVDADGIRFFGSGHVISRNYIHDIKYGIPENQDPHIDCFQTWGVGSYHEAARDVVIERNVCINLQSQALREAGQGSCWRMPPDW